ASDRNGRRPAADEGTGRQGIVRQGETARRNDAAECVFESRVDRDSVCGRWPYVVRGHENILDRTVRQILVGDLVDRPVRLGQAQVVLAPEVVGVDEPGDVLVHAQDVVAEGDERRPFVRVESVLVPGRDALEV